MIVRHQPHFGPDLGPTERANWDAVHRGSLTSSDFNGLTSTIVSSASIIVPSPGVLFDTSINPAIQVSPDFQFTTSDSVLALASLFMSSQIVAPGTPLSSALVGVSSSGTNVLLGITSSGLVFESTVSSTGTAASTGGSTGTGTGAVQVQKSSSVVMTSSKGSAVPIITVSSWQGDGRAAVVLAKSVYSIESFQLLEWELFKGTTTGTTLDFSNAENSTGGILEGSITMIGLDRTPSTSPVYTMGCRNVLSTGTAGGTLVFQNSVTVYNA